MVMHIIVIMLLASIVFAYDMVCPDGSQRQLRSRGLCARNNLPNLYTCLEDVNRQTFIESCLEEEEAVRPGKKYVIRGQTTGSDCSKLRYQPIKFYKTSAAVCLYLKSSCSEVGQVVARNGSGIADTTCICDYTEGYAYVTKPYDVCNCVPSREDCTCYKEMCPDNKCTYINRSSVTVCDTVYKSGKDATLTIRTEFTEPNASATGAHYFTSRISVTVIIVLLWITGSAVIMCVEDRQKSSNSGKKVVKTSPSATCTTSGKDDEVDGSKKLTDSGMEVFNTSQSTNFAVNGADNRDEGLKNLTKSGKEDVKTSPSATCAVRCTDDEVEGSKKLTNSGIENLLNAVRTGDIKAVEVCLKDGADVKYTDSNGYTPLHYASESGCKEIANLLLNRGAIVDSRDSYKRTPLHLAAEFGKTNITSLLFKDRATVNIKDKEGRTPLHQATLRGRKDTVFSLLNNKANVNIEDNDKQTPLHMAAVNGLKDTAELLIKYSAKVDMQNEYGRTPLHLAAELGKTEMVILLIDNGADVNIKDKEGETPLHYAAWWGRKETTQQLINHGAAKDIRDNDGKTPYDVAKDDIKTLLKK